MVTQRPADGSAKPLIGVYALEQKLTSKPKREDPKLVTIQTGVSRVDCVPNADKYSMM
jgi:hypothetical protein